MDDVKLQNCQAYFSINNAFRITLTILTTIAPPKADQKPKTTKPVNNEEVNPKIMALIIKVNSPSVNILRGRVNIISMGLMDIFNNPKIIEAISRSDKLLNNIPGKIKLAAPNDNELITHLNTTFLNTNSSSTNN
jgi:hypothetical protein